MEVISIKECRICLILKDINSFGKRSGNKDGLNTLCKQCENSRIKNWIAKNSDKFKSIQKKWISNNKDKRRLADKRHRDKVKPIKKNKPTSIGKLSIKEYRSKYRKYKFETDLNFKLKERLRGRIVLVLRSRNIKKSNRTKILIGCEIDFFKKHLESKFLPTMTWENYGKYWHIDHIIPCAKFDLTKEEEQKKCFHYSNLQPLFAVTQIINNITYIGNLNKPKK